MRQGLVFFIMLSTAVCMAAHSSLAQAHATNPDDPPSTRPFRVAIVEHTTGWPVPLVELRTTGNLRFFSDNAGLIAIDAPELFDRETWFFIECDGYETPADGFGYRGVRLTPVAGASAVIAVKRTDIAQRLGRLTGAGLFAESRKLGERLDHAESGVVGADSVQNAVHRDHLFWVWGDTTLFHYPLGLFSASGATTPIRPIEEFVPPLSLPLNYFRDAATDRPRNVAEMPGPGPTWLTGLISLPDAEGNDRLTACYAKIRKPMNVYEWGLCVWNDETEQFERARVIWRDPAGAEGTDPNQAAMHPMLPEGHAVKWVDDDGQPWVLFGNPFPKFRCRATFEAWSNVETWETLAPPTSLRIAASDDQPVAAPRTIRPHSGSIAWHPWRRRWVAVFMQWWGAPSAFGEVWYAEAESPLGPWGPAVKILSHANDTFYNPRVHGEWFDEDSPVLTFEGTRSKEFSKTPAPIPRYDYNQILYRLDLDDPRLRPAQR